jgi:endonuclease YncB( thermonuclease family)
MRLTAVLVCSMLSLVAAVLTVQSQRPLAAKYRDLIGKDIVAKVMLVTDGDTLDVLVAGEQRAIEIRLLGVDTPEQNESFSVQARNATRILAFDREVVIRADRVERSGRLTASVRVNGVDLGLELVRQGLACHDTAYSSDAALAQAEADAKRQERGIWGRGVQKPRCVARKDGSIETEGFRGNTESKLYHTANCRNYRCKNCTAQFATEAEAKAAGFRPAKDCF